MFRPVHGFKWEKHRRLPHPRPACPEKAVLLAARPADTPSPHRATMVIRGACAPGAGPSANALSPKRRKGSLRVPARSHAAHIGHFRAGGARRSHLVTGAEPHGELDRARADLGRGQECI